MGLHAQVLHFCLSTYFLSLDFTFDPKLAVFLPSRQNDVLTKSVWLGSVMLRLTPQLLLVTFLLSGPHGTLLSCRCDGRLPPPPILCLCHWCAVQRVLLTAGLLLHSLAYRWQHVPRGHVTHLVPFSADRVGTASPAVLTCLHGKLLPSLLMDP